MVYTPAGTLMLACSYLREGMAAGSVLQTWMSAANAAAAKARIHYFGLPKPAGDRYTADELDTYRPFAFMYPLNDRISTQRGPREFSGMIDVVLEQAAAEGFNQEPTAEENANWLNTVGQIVDEMVDDKDTAGYLAFESIDLVDWCVNEPEDVEEQGLWQRALLSIRFGNSI